MKRLSASIMLFASVYCTQATATAMQVFDKLLTRTSYCIRNDSKPITIHNAIFESLRDKEKQKTIFLLSWSMYYDCLGNVQKRLISALQKEGLNPESGNFKIYTQSRVDTLAEPSKTFYHKHLQEINKVRNSLKLPLDYGSFDVLATVEKYAPISYVLMTESH